MLVHADLHTVLHASLEDKLGVLGCHFTSLDIGVGGALRCLEYHKERLDHMVAMHVHGQLHDLCVERSDHLHQVEVVQRVTRVRENVFCQSVDQSLNSPSSVYIQRNIYNLPQGAHHNLIESLWVRHFNDFLAEIVAELVYHDTWEDWEHLVDQAFEEFAFIFLIKFPLLNFGLKVSASCLIEAVKFKSH